MLRAAGCVTLVATRRGAKSEDEAGGVLVAAGVACAELFASARGASLVAGGGARFAHMLARACCFSLSLSVMSKRPRTVVIV